MQPAPDLRATGGGSASRTRATAPTRSRSCGWRTSAARRRSIRVRHWRVGGREVHHIIDPRTGEPADSGLLSVTVVGPDTARAEVWSKALFLAGRGRVRQLADERDIAALLVDDDGVVGISRAMRTHLIWQADSWLLASGPPPVARCGPVARDPRMRGRAPACAGWLIGAAARSVSGDRNAAWILGRAAGLRPTSCSSCWCRLGLVLSHPGRVRIRRPSAATRVRLHVSLAVVHRWCWSCCMSWSWPQTRTRASVGAGRSCPSGRPTGRCR